MKKRSHEAAAHSQATTIDYTDGGRNADDRKIMQSQAQISEDTISEIGRPEPSHRRPHGDRASSANVLSNSFKTHTSHGSSMAMQNKIDNHRSQSQEMKS